MTVHIFVLPSCSIYYPLMMGREATLGAHQICLRGGMKKDAGQVSSDVRKGSVVRE